MEVTSLQYSIDAAYKFHMHVRQLRFITATLANRMNELITLLGEGHEVEK